MTTIYEAANHILIHTGYRDPACHSHMAAQIIVLPEGEMEVTLDGRKLRCPGIMIPSGVSHRIDTGGKAALVFLFDSTTHVSGQIREVFPLSEEISGKIAGLYAEMDRKGGSYGTFYRGFLEAVGMTEAPGSVKDPRILAAMAYIRCHLSDSITCSRTARAVCLSESRFSHLFRQETGMTFAAYVIYQRIMYVYAQRLRGKNLTEAAIAAGFGGSAHFADVNRRIFGLPATQITRDWLLKSAEI